MPVRNAMPYLAECMDSILMQDFPDWELIAIDDNSTDESGAVLMQYANQDSRIHTYRNLGTGIISALRLAYDHSSGQLLTRMDADDIMLPQRLSHMSTSLSTYGTGHLAVGQVEYFRRGGIMEGYARYAAWLNRLIASGTCFREIFRECVIPSPCWMLHRVDLERCGAFRPNVYPEDYDLCFRMDLAGLRQIPCDMVLHRWRDHGARASRNDEHYRDDSFLDIKCHYYWTHYRKDDRPAILFGAGKKAKAIARDAVNRGKQFVWLTDNPRKIGQTIYGVTLENTQTYLHSACLMDSRESKDQSVLSYQWILAISSPRDQERIISALEAFGGEVRQDWDLFF